MANGTPLDSAPPALAELEQQMRRHVEELAGAIGERHVFRHGALERAAQYIAATFLQQGHAPASQPFTAQGRSVRNIEAELPGVEPHAEIVVLGAHYDSVPGCPGANDNASGIAALLEIARALRSVRVQRTVRFVAFVNEEPPFFQGPEMGSLVYARRSRERGERIAAMLSLETIGYYTDEPHTQKYPPPLNLLYPSTGNFIGLVGNLGSRRLLSTVSRSFRRATSFPMQSALAPASLPGVGWSDHWAFWDQGYPAVMLTDTAPYRYPHYHTAEDTPDRLRYPEFAAVVGGLIHVTRVLAFG
jgi:Zn-dependent M28 family amino/carboxypeptidase